MRATVLLHRTFYTLRVKWTAEGAVKCKGKEDHLCFMQSILQRERALSDRAIVRSLKITANAVKQGGTADFSPLTEL